MNTKKHNLYFKFKIKNYYDFSFFAYKNYQVHSENKNI